MRTKRQLLEDFDSSIKDIQQFIDNANYNGGMHFEARLKLVENQVQDLYWLVRQVLNHLPESETQKVVKDESAV